MSERVLFVEFEWKYHNFLNIKTGNCYLKLLFDYWNDLVLGSIEAYFMEVGAHVSLKRATAGVWGFILAEFKWKYQNSLNIKTRKWDLETLLFDYWNYLVLGSVEIYFHIFFLVLEVFQIFHFLHAPSPTLLEWKFCSSNGTQQILRNILPSVYKKTFLIKLKIVGLVHI